MSLKWQTTFWTTRFWSPDDWYECNKMMDSVYGCKNDGCPLYRVVACECFQCKVGVSGMTLIGCWNLRLRLTIFGEGNLSSSPVIKRTHCSLALNQQNATPAYDHPLSRLLIERRDPPLLPLPKPACYKVSPVRIYPDLTADLARQCGEFLKCQITTLQS